MQGQIAARVELGLAGALGAGLWWLVLDAASRGEIGGYTALGLSGLILTLIGALLAMAGPLGLRRALPRAAGLAVIAGGLVWLTRLRYGDVGQFLATPLPSLAGFAVATLPVPFLVAAGRTRWNDYPLLFLEAWGIALRLAAAMTFTGFVWLVILLSDQVLRIVGIGALGQLMQHQAGVMILSGAALGLGMAVIHDLAEVASPYLVLRLFRLFLPLVLGVMAIFLIALPIRGFEGLTGGFSPAMLLLVLVGAGITLISITVDQSDGEAVRSPVLIRAAQGTAILLPIIAGLALWAIGLRIGQHGWTPERVFVALVGGLGLGYGLVYALAVLRGKGWMERIRQGNLRMILLVIALAAAWLTPVLNAEAISARDQLARLRDGRTPVEALDPLALGRWGRPGAEALAELAALAKEPGQEALAERLAGEGAGSGPDRARLAADLAAVLPVEPATATGTRDTLLPAVEAYLLQDWLQLCGGGLATGGAPCLMVVADLMPTIPGEEAFLFLTRSAGDTEIVGLYLDAAGLVHYRSASHPDGRVIDAAEAKALMESYRQSAPPVTAALLNQLGTGEDGLILQP